MVLGSRGTAHPKASARASKARAAAAAGAAYTASMPNAPDPWRRRATLAALGAALPLSFAACGAAPLAPVSASAAGVGVRVRFHLDLRAAITDGRFDPARDTVGVRGAIAPLGWDRTLAPTPWPGRPGWYRAEVVLAAAAAQPLAHKFKIDRPGAAPDDGWETGRNRAAAVSGPETVVERAFGDDPGAPAPRRTGRIERIAPMPSAYVTPREIQVWLPPGYGESPSARYPVLVMHDGQNLFDHIAAGAEWQVDEAAEAGVRDGTLAPFIVSPWPAPARARSTTRQCRYGARAPSRVVARPPTVATWSRNCCRSSMRVTPRGRDPRTALSADRRSVGWSPCGCCCVTGQSSAPGLSSVHRYGLTLISRTRGD